MTGRIVVLNGPSSAGKTTLAGALGERLDTPWHLFPVDLLHAVRSRPDLHGNEVEWPPVLRATRAGYHRALAGLAHAGCDVIADHVLSEPWRLTDLLEVTSAVPVLLVHVTCAPDVLADRERARGDRGVGTALAQLDTVFAHGDADLLVDTTTRHPAQCAAQVAALITDPPRVTAFDRLRRARVPR